MTIPVDAYRGPTGVPAGPSAVPGQDPVPGGPNEVEYDEFELRDRETLRQAGIDPDEVSTSSSADISLTLDLPPAQEISRGDDGLERWSCQA